MRQAPREAGLEGSVNDEESSPAAAPDRLTWVGVLDHAAAIIAEGNRLSSTR